MNPNLIVIIAIAVAMDVFIVWAIFSGLRSTMRDFAAQFPPRIPAADAVVRRRQSLRVNIYKLGSAFTLAVDAEYLHLVPSRFGGFFGAVPLSIPWGAIAVQGVGRRSTTAKVGRSTIAGPKWVFEPAVKP
ncbi:hypothetical protein BH11PLA1_BH11PLA1_13200 [soil metagenome]